MKIFVFLLAGVFAFLSVFHVWSWSFRTPVGCTYLWVGHYWEDYFTYLSQIDQGIRGKFLFENLMTGEMGQASLIGWGNLLIGWLGRMLGLSAVLSYWLGVLWFNFLLIILTFLVVRMIFEKEENLRLPAFLVFLFSSSFYWWVGTGEKRLALVSHWYSTGPAFNRIGGTPHHAIANILLLGSLLLFGMSLKMIREGKINLKFFGVVMGNGILGGLNFLVKPGWVLVFYFSFGAVLLLEAVRDYLKNKKINFNFLLPILGFLPFLVAGGFYTLNLFGKEHFLEMKRWDMVTVERLEIKNFFLSFGPVILLGLAGVKSFLRKFEPIRTMGFLVVLLTFLLVLLPAGRMIGFLPYRVVSPVAHIFIGSMAILGLRSLAGGVVKFFKRGDEKKIFLVLLILFLAFCLPALALEIKGKIEDPAFDFEVNYMASGINEGFLFLRGVGEEDEVVLIADDKGLNAVLPALAAKRVYVGRTIETLDYDNKRKKLRAFFQLKMGREEANDFLRENKIKYVLITAYDGGVRNFQEKYDLGKKIFENTMVTIFELD
jgi:hypothetical protein